MVDGVRLDIWLGWEDGLKDKSKGVGLGLVDALGLLEGTKDDEGEKEGDLDNWLVGEVDVGEGLDEGAHPS